MLNQKIIAVVIFIILARGQTGIADLLWDYNVGEDYQGLSEFSSYSPPSLDCCFCLAIDGNRLLVGTSEGVMCWNLQKDKIKIFKTDANWEGEYAKTLRDANEKNYVEKWLSNSVERIVVLSPGQIWVDMFKGVLVIRDGQEVYYASLEEALQSLYNSDLKKLLKKVAAVDSNEHLYLLKGKKEGFINSSILKYYDGTVWKEEQSRLCDKGRAFSQKKFLDVAADAKGNIWTCGYEGILQRRGNCWDIVEGGGYAKFWLDNDGTLWALGWGKLAKLEDNGWKVYKGEGKCKEFSVLQHYLHSQLVIFQTTDNKLWFAASINDEGRVVCFDGKDFTATSICPLSAAISPSGQAYAASGERLFHYKESKWEQIGQPKFRAFRNLGGGEGRIIEDILAAGDGSVYVATNKEGLLRYRNGSWKKISCEKDKQDAKPIEQGVVAGRVPEMSEEDRFMRMPEGPVPESLIQAVCKAYIEADGEELVKASDEKLAENVVQGDRSTSPVSYYRLLHRNEKLAKASLPKKIEAMCAEDYGEGWLSLEIATYGPAVIEILLEVAKQGTAQQRALAIDSLGHIRDPKAVDKLLNIFSDYDKLDGLSYFRLARAAIMVGNPRGIDLLIEAATRDKQEERSCKFSLRDVRKLCREELDRITQSYDDVPSDWSHGKWKEWWKKHRNDWRAEDVYPRGLSEALIVSGQKIFQAVAERIEKEK